MEFIFLIVGVTVFFVSFFLYDANKELLATFCLIFGLFLTIGSFMFVIVHAYSTTNDFNSKCISVGGHLYTVDQVTLCLRKDNSIIEIYP